jgi:hypothetical protein
MDCRLIGDTGGQPWATKFDTPIARMTPSRAGRSWRVTPADDAIAQVLPPAPPRRQPRLRTTEPP